MMARQGGRPRSARAQTLQEARRVQRTSATIAAAVLALVVAALGPLLTIWSVEEVAHEYGVLAVRSPLTGSLPPFLLTYIAAVSAGVGALGMLTRQHWGWWCAAAGAGLGLADLARLYAGLFGSINPDHPRASEVTLELLGIVGLPAILFAAVVAVLASRSVRAACRVSSRGRTPKAGTLEGEEG